MEPVKPVADLLNEDLEKLLHDLRVYNAMPKQQDSVEGLLTRLENMLKVSKEEQRKQAKTAIQELLTRILPNVAIANEVLVAEANHMSSNKALADTGPRHSKIIQRSHSASPVLSPKAATEATEGLPQHALDEGYHRGWNAGKSFGTHQAQQAPQNNSKEAQDIGKGQQGQPVMASEKPRSVRKRLAHKEVLKIERAMGVKMENEHHKRVSKVDAKSEPNKKRDQIKHEAVGRLQIEMV